MYSYRRREQDASDRDKQRYKNQLDVTGSEKGQLEKLRLQLTEQVCHTCIDLILCSVVVCCECAISEH